MIPWIFYALMVIKSMVSIEADACFADKVLRFARSMTTFTGRGGAIQEKAKPPRDTKTTVAGNHDVNDNESINSSESGSLVTEDDASDKKSS